MSHPEYREDQSVPLSKVSLEFRDLYLHPRFYPAAYSIEIHYVLCTDSRVVLGYQIQRVSGFHSIDGIVCICRNRGFVLGIRLCGGLAA